MHYFDNAATTFPKPESVYATMDSFLRTAAGNPGRGVHRLALAADETIYETRRLLARLFGACDPAHLLFATNATDALNLALHGVLEPGDHVVTSSMEHNAVVRPLAALAKQGVAVTTVACATDGTLDPDRLLAAVQSTTRLVVLAHASNVTGTILPIEEIAAEVRARDRLLLVDAAQTAGVLPIDVQAMNIDLLAFPGHKELLGPPGTGGLVVGERVRLNPIRQGGTGTHSEQERQPTDLPEGFEVGTLNSVGLAGLGAGVRFILETGLGLIRAHQKDVLRRLVQGLSAVPGLTLYGPCDADRQVGVVSVNLDGWEPTDLGVALDQDFEVAVRTGLHCAPLAHRTIGTFPTGTVRLSPGYFTTLADVEWVIAALEHLARQSLRGVGRSEPGV